MEQCDYHLTDFRKVLCGERTQIRRHLPILDEIVLNDDKTT